MRDLNHLYAGAPGALRATISIRRASSGSTAATPNTASSRSCGAAPSPDSLVACVFNWTPVVREGYRVGVPDGGDWRVVINTDDPRWGGSGAGTMGTIEASGEAAHGFAQSLPLTLPPLGALILERCAIGARR